VEGVVDGYNDVGVFCHPKGVTYNQATKIVITYAHANPQLLHEQAWKLVPASQIKAFPCQNFVTRLRDPMKKFDFADRLIVAHEIEKLRKAIAAERAAILKLIEAQRVDGHLYDGDYCLQTVAAAIGARAET
jgi:hypothetical protein